MGSEFWIEAVGWAASVITVATYAMSTMVSLRVLAVCSSLLFMVYAFVLQLWPLFVMDCILLPINGYRLWQILSLRGRLSSLSADVRPDFSIVKRYGTRERFDAGTKIFKKGDDVDKFYFIAEGEVLIQEHDAKLSEGDIFGEIAFFTVGAKRNASALSASNTLVFALDKERFMRLQFEDPSFGLAVMQSVTSRLSENSASESMKSH